MNDELKIGIVGFGYAAQVFHTPFLQADKRYRVVAVCERHGERSKNYFPEVQIVRSYDALLREDLDLVLITTPNPTHYDFARQALMAGKHVVVDKPLAGSVREACHLAELAAERHLLLTVFQNRRWDSAIATARQLIERKTLGEIVDCRISIERYAATKNPKQWKESGAAGTGLVYDLGVHLIDQAMHLFGLPHQVYADMRCQHEGSICEDNFMIALYYQHGLKVLLAASRYAAQPAPYLVLHGTRGSYVKQEADCQETLLAKGTPIVAGWNAETEVQWGILHTMTEQGKPTPYPSVATSYQAFYDNLYQALQGEARLAVLPKEAINVLKIIELAYISAKEGRLLTLDSQV